MDVVEQYEALVRRLPQLSLEEQIRVDLAKRLLIVGSGTGQPQGVVRK